MPYIVCVNQPGCLPEQSPVATATIEDAREAAKAAIIDGPYDFGVDEHIIATYALREQGGVIGPLPDGYVIDVQYVSYGAMWEAATGSKANQPVETQDIIDAYNAQG
jgi:hypothetical protein